MSCEAQNRTNSSLSVNWILTFLNLIFILRGPGAASQDDAIFSGERAEDAPDTYSYLTSWLARINKEVHPGDSVAFLYEVVFFVDSSFFLMESFRKKDARKPRKSHAVTWVLGNNTFRSIFSPKVYRKFL